MTRRSVLVTGGAGYIGSHMVRMLDQEGFDVTTADNLSTGHRDAVVAGRFVHVDLRDREGVARLFSGARYDLVMHFAAYAEVGESVVDPRKYYVNNVVGSLNLLNGMGDAGVGALIFSSTCATYGIPGAIPLVEEHPQSPVNPYGRTKLAVEHAISDYAEAGRMKAIAMRYFNAAGASLGGDLRERHSPETHLIPLVLSEAARVKSGAPAEATQLAVFGDDYPTRDGTCIRDYVHVDDVCSAHLLAARRLLDGASAGFEAFNLGSESGASVLEVIEVARQVTGADVRARRTSRRAGDPPVLIGSSTRARRVLGWNPTRSDLENVVRSAWAAAGYPRP